MAEKNETHERKIRDRAGGQVLVVRCLLRAFCSRSQKLSYGLWIGIWNNVYWIGCLAECSAGHRHRAASAPTRT